MGEIIDLQWDKETRTGCVILFREFLVLLIVLTLAQCPMNFFTVEMNKSQDEA